MNPSPYQWLAGVIYAHPEHQVVGRTRLQKTIRLLQRLGLPTDYSYQLYFYGPYSDAVLSAVQLLEQLGLIEEQQQINLSGDPYYILKAHSKAELDGIKKFQKHINKMVAADAVVLELAATYDAFRDLGSDHKEALVRLKNKKGTKCGGGNQQRALELLKELGLPTT